jgi:outer membrane protein
VKLAVLAGVVCALVFLVTPDRETKEPVVSVGFVDMPKLLNEYYQTQIKQREFEARLKKEEEDLEIKKKPAEEIDKLLKEGADTLPEQELRELRDRLNEELRILMDYRDRRNRALRRDQEDMEKELYKELQQAVQEYGTREGYSVIVRKSMLLYGSQTCDLTQDIIDTVNRQQ